jgi:hypothetical protein
MENELIEFETAKLAKEKGFDEYSNAYYYHDDLRLIKVLNKNSVDNIFKENSCSAPTQSLLQRWLREVHKLFINIAIFKESEEKPVVYDYAITNLNNPYDINDCEIFLKDYGIEKDRDHFSFEEALEEGLKSALELIK